MKGCCSTMQSKGASSAHCDCQCKGAGRVAWGDVGGGGSIRKAAATIPKWTPVCGTTHRVLQHQSICVWYLCNFMCMYKCKCKCRCACVCVCLTCTRVSECDCACVYVSVRLCLCLALCVCVSAWLCVHGCTCMHVWYVCLHARVGAWLHVHACLHACIGSYFSMRRKPQMLCCSTHQRLIRF